MKNEMSAIKDIIKIVGESKLTELNIEREEFNLFIKKSDSGVQPKINTKVEKIETTIENNENKKEVVSENVGRFYFATTAEGEILQVGDKISKGQKIGYVEAIGIKTNITSEFDGEIKEILIKNGEIAEYGKVLILL